ncbi:MAG: sugar MFS transporter [Bacteroidaceae bacterium]|nr:sugar MFS transporter [Bacteroidaceae bacterium]
MKSSLTERRYVVPFVLITSLFFLWGFARAILDVLNKHFQTELNISITQSSLVQVTTYLGYFLMAIPAGLLINKVGYKRGVVTGLLLYAIGAFLFVPGTWANSFSGYLVALFVIACGLVFLETAANPYATELGPKETASSRLNLSQSFNGMGSALAPIVVGGLLFSGSGADVSLPYVVMGVIVLLVALVFSRSQLPEIQREEEQSSNEEVSGLANLRRLFHNRTFLFGLGALLAYEVSEISINSYFINFTTGMGWLTAANASYILGLSLFIFMGGRFVGSWIMRRIPAQRVLLWCACGSVLSIALLILNGHFSMVNGQWSIVLLVANYFFEAIMFPTIFSLSLRGLGSLTKSASSLLMMTPVGGCGFLLMALFADYSGSLILPFLIPLLGYVVVLLYAQRQVRAEVISE